MDTKRICPSCGQPLAPNAPMGLCPECLVKAGFPTGAESDTGSGTQRGFVPPTVEEMAKLFPQLEILEFIGKGGMGAIYKARQKQLNRVVALKILPPGIGSDPAFAERFTREAQALARLNHPNIVTLYEFGQANGQFYFLMEFVDGMNLRQLLQSGRISSREALAIVPQICDALQFAHDQGIVHRDIKPENILLDRRGRVKVADFGLAKLVGRTEPANGGAISGSPVLTESGKIMGTPNYMAPEQKENPAEVDHRADIYALGVVFYQMLTGELPGRRLEPPSKKVHIDVRLDEVVLRALEKKPELRYQQVSEVKTQVETIAANPETESEAASADTMRYENSQWNFALQIPRSWNAFPPVPSNSPAEVIRFASNEGGTHCLIIFRTPYNPRQTLKEKSDSVRKQLAAIGFGNFVFGETSIGGKPAATLDFDRQQENGTWSCRHYFLDGSTLAYTLGFGTTNKAGMFELFDRVAKSFEFKEAARTRLEPEGVPIAGVPPGADPVTPPASIRPIVSPRPQPCFSKAKMAITIGVAVVLAAGIAVIVVKAFFFLGPTDSYFLPNYGHFQGLPSGLFILRPTHFSTPANGLDYSCETDSPAGDHVTWNMGRNRSFAQLLCRIYNCDTNQIALPPGAPSEHFDYLYTLRDPDGLQHFEAAIRKLGYTAHWEDQPVRMLVVERVTASTPPGPVGFWSGENSGKDAVGHNDAVLTDVTFTNGLAGQAFYLNGSNADVRIPDSIALRPTNITVEVWVKLDALASPVARYPGLQYIVFKQNSRGGNFEGYELEKNRIDGQDMFRFQVTSADGEQVPTAATTVPRPGVWYFLVGTYDGETVKIYVNGELEGTAPAGFPLDYGPHPLFIGTSGTDWDGRVQGAVENVAIYNRALPAEEIKAFYLKMAARIPSLLPPPTASKPMNSDDAAVSAAQSWLSLIDNGNYQESWNEAAPFFQNAVAELDWENSMNTYRKPLGDLLARKLKSLNHQTQMPGAPDGEYVVMQFDTSFTDKKSAVETVTVGPKADGQWKVSGYYIK